MSIDDKRKKKDRKKVIFKAIKKQDKINNGWWTAESIYRMVNILDEKPDMTWSQLQHKMKKIDEYEKSCDLTEEDVNRAKRRKKRDKGTSCFC